MNLFLLTFLCLAGFIQCQTTVADKEILPDSIQTETILLAERTTTTTESSSGNSTTEYYTETIDPNSSSEDMGTSPDVTFEDASTSPPLIHTTTVEPLIMKGTVTCSGWCLETKKLNHVLNLTVNATNDEKLMKTFYLIKALVENLDAYPVRADANIFADKQEYLDNDTPKARSRLFSKNIIKIPTTVFFPYTRSEIKQAIMNSGSTYVPNLDQKTNTIKEVNTYDGTPFGYLWQMPDFSNQYFETNPLLHNNMKYKPMRRTNRRKLSEDYLGDPYNIDSTKPQPLFEVTIDGEEDNRRANPIQLKSGTLADFIYKGSVKNQRTRANKIKGDKVDDVLGLAKKDTILEPSPNSVNEIIAGMKIKGKSTFIIGATKNARSKINKWVSGPKARSRLPNAQGTGVILEGKSKTRAMNLLLKSMIQNYQFGDNTPKYKKIHYL